MFLLIFILISFNIYSYPNFIGHGYKSCVTCHYNPFGNGPLTDYGRALGATAISDRMFFPSSWSEEKIGKKSGFLFREPAQNFFRPSVNYRSLYLKQNFNTEKEKSDFIVMMANLNFVVKGGENDKYAGVFTLGYAPEPRRMKFSNKQKTIRTREHYLKMQINPNWGIYAGAFDKVYGIRIPDHISFSRSIPGMTMNDQTHGVLGHYKNSFLEAGLHAFIGNLEQEMELRQQGFSSKVEFDLTKSSRSGFSLLKSESDYLKTESLSVHHKHQISKGSSILFEGGTTIKTSEITKIETKSYFTLLQNHLWLRRGTYMLATFEYLNPDSTRKDKVMRLGPGFQYFINNGLEIRFDFYNTRTISESTVSEDIWDLTGQVHMWF